MSAIRKIVATNLRVLRTARRLTQTKLAKAAGLDRSYLCDVEREIYAPSVETIEALAEALGVAPWEMLHPLTATETRKDNKRSG